MCRCVGIAKCRLPLNVAVYGHLGVVNFPRSARFNHFALEAIRLPVTDISLELQPLPIQSDSIRGIFRPREPTKDPASIRVMSVRNYTEPTHIVNRLSN